MAVVSYEPLPGGGWIAHHDDGMIEYFDANWNPLGTDASGTATGTPQPTTPAPAFALPAPTPAPPPRPMKPGDVGVPQEQAAPVPTTAPQAPIPRGFDSSAMMPPGGDAPTGGNDLTGYGGQLSAGNPFSDAPGAVTDNPYGGTPTGAPQPAPAPQMPHGYSGGFGNPTYADGTQNPLQGGAPRTPGGAWNDGSSGYRKQLYVGGVAAGPFDTHGDPGPSTPAYGGSSGGSGGGGGTSALYNAVKAKGNAMESKVRGMASAIQGKIGAMGGGSSGGYSSGSSSYGGNTPAYQRQQQQYKQQQRQQQRAYADGSYLYGQYKMRGFSKHFDPQQALGLQSRPTGILPKVAGGVDPTSPHYDWLSNLPASQLSMILYGGHGKTGKPLMSTTYNSNGQARKTPMTGLTLGGIGSTTRGPSTFTNNLAKFYQQMAQTGDGLDYDTLTHKLTSARGKSQLGAMFKNQPAGTAAANYESMMNAILENTGLDPTVAAARAKVGERDIDEYMSHSMKKAPTKTPMINRYVGRQLFG